jgi:6-phosphogluconolactonase
MNGSIQKVRDLADLSWAGAKHFVKAAAESIAARGVFHVAISGGATPLPMYALMALPEWVAKVDWPKVHVYWADERCVPPDHDQSNYGAAHHAMLGKVGIPEGNIHRMRGEMPPEEAALAYEALIADVTFDVIQLGMGNDGHTASLFPNTAVIHEQKRRVASLYVPHMDSWRITLTPPAINAAREVIFMISGGEKAEVLRQIFHGPYEPDRLPSQIINPSSGKFTWVLDEAAAAQL